MLYTPTDHGETASDRPPGLLLVPMVAKDRYSWDAFARAAQTAGYMSLAIDLPYAYEAPAPDEKEHALASLAVAKDVLIERGADPDDIVVIGASLGANLAAHFLSADAALFGAILISPGREYRGVACDGAVVQAAGRRPLLVMVAKGDSYAAATARSLREEAAGLFELREYEGSAHGTDLLDRSEHASAQALVWLDQMLNRGPEATTEDTPQ